MAKAIVFRFVLLGLILIQCACNRGYDDDYYYYRVDEYKQVVKISDTTRLIKTIRYIGSELVDSPNALVAGLKLSPYKPTQFTVNDSVENYDFEVVLDFKTTEVETSFGENYIKTLEKISLTKSSVPNARFVRNKTSNSNGNNLIIDSLIIP